jgi:hypothetical protein
MGALPARNLRTEATHAAVERAAPRRPAQATASPRERTWRQVAAYARSNRLAAGAAPGRKCAAASAAAAVASSATSANAAPRRPARAAPLDPPVGPAGAPSRSCNPMASTPNPVCRNEHTYNCPQPELPSARPTCSPAPTSPLEPDSRIGRQKSGRLDHRFRPRSAEDLHQPETEPRLLGSLRQCVSTHPSVAPVRSGTLWLPTARRLLLSLAEATLAVLLLGRVGADTVQLRFGRRRAVSPAARDHRIYPRTRKSGDEAARVASWNADSPR